MISVLYVEDDTSLLEIGKFLLEKDGSIEVDTCSSVNDALKNIGGKRYDVILSDYAMPGTNGIHFLKSLRSAGDTTPFFFFAGKGRKSVIIDALNLGADFYLEKAGNAKVQFEEIAEAIKRAAAQKSACSKPELTDSVPRSVLESVSEGVLVVDQQGKITTYNQHLLSLLKIPEELVSTGADSQVLLESLRDQLADPDDFSRKTETINGDPGTPCQGTIHLKQGQVIAWSSHVQKTGDTISGMVWNFRDISEQTLAEFQRARVTEQLTATEEELRRLRQDQETDQTRAEHQLATVNGQLKAAEEESNRLREDLKIDQTRAEHQLATVNGQLKAAEEESNRLRQGREIDQTRAEHQLATVKDQLKTAEEELRNIRRDLEAKEKMVQESEEIIGIITRAAADGILTSIDGKIVEANEKFAEMLGYSTTELAGRSLPDFISPDSPGEAINAVRSGSGGKYECSALHRNGSSFRAEITGYPAMYRGDTVLVTIVHRVSGTPAPQQEKGPESSTVQAGPMRGEAGESEERVPEAGPGAEILQGPVPPVAAPAGITPPERIPPAKEPAGVSLPLGPDLIWEVDETQKVSDFGRVPPSQDIDPGSLISEIEDIIGPDESLSSRDKGKQYISQLLSDLKRKKRRFF